jgi:hypothetical protein
MASTRARLFLVLAALWMLAMTARLYPEFGDRIRVDGRPTTVASYLEEACAQRVGPAAVTCFAERGEEAQLLLRQEQGKSILFVIAPLLIYFVVWHPARLLRERIGTRFLRRAD